MADIPIDIVELERLQSIETRVDEVLIQIMEAPAAESPEAQGFVKKVIEALTFVKSGKRE